MKNILIIFFLCSQVAFGYTKAMLIEPIPERTVTLPDESVKIVEEKHLRVTVYSSDSETLSVKKITDVDEIAKFDGVLRQWVYFNEDGSINKSDVHTAGPFKSDIKLENALSSQEKAKIESVKTK